MVATTDNLTQRVLTHCQGIRTTSIGTSRESNIRHPIKFVKERGYEVVFRISILDFIDAKRAETDLLRMYDYAWNIKDNHKIY